MIFTKFSTLTISDVRNCYRFVICDLIEKQNTTGGGSAVQREKCCHILYRGAHDQDRLNFTGPGV